MPKRISSLDAFIDASRPYVHRFDMFVAKHGLAKDIVADHICYRCRDSEEYDRMRLLLEERPTRFSYQSWVSGRRVSVIVLREHLINSAAGSIDYVELCDCKPGVIQENHFHHIWFYKVGTRDPRHVSLAEDLADRLRIGGENVVLDDRPHCITYDVIQPTNGFIFRFGYASLLDYVLDEIKAEKAPSQ